MAGDTTAFLPIFQEIDRRLALRQPILVAIDGMAAAGKSTLGILLAEHYSCNLIHMDDFFLPPALRTPQRRSEPGGNIHYERFLREVVSGLKAGLPFQYGVFDCHSMEISHSITVKPTPITVVEGAYSLHPALGDIYDLKIFYSVDPAVQLERIHHRNGPACVPAFRDIWIPLEQAYFIACHVQDCCDIIL